MKPNLFHNLSTLLLGLSLSAPAFALPLMWRAPKLGPVEKLQDASFFKQKLFHDRPEDTRTFNQRFYVDSSNAVDENSPVFYLICGEAECRGTGEVPFAAKLAQQYRAHLVALEHRFYGRSMPSTTLSSANLESLTIESAINDLANFQRYAMDKLGLKGKWVSFGGSYPGGLSAFYRLKHPELVVGALASSAPVFIKAEFNEYDAHIASVINRTSCGKAVLDAVKVIEEMVQTPEGFAQAKQYFGVPQMRLVEDFMYTVADSLAAAVQYGTHEQFCQTLQGPGNPVENYGRAGQAAVSVLGASLFDISMQAAENLDGSDPSSNFRQWMWQSCTEFGWFQTANYQTSEGTSRSLSVDLAYHERLCQRLFGRPATVKTAMNDTWYMRFFDPETQHIIFTNGGNDPWQGMSIRPDSVDHNAGLELFLMDGASHCNDLSSWARLASVMQTQTQLTDIIGGWLR